MKRSFRLNGRSDLLAPRREVKLPLQGAFPFSPENTCFHYHLYRRLGPQLGIKEG